MGDVQFKVISIIFKILGFWDMEFKNKYTRGLYKIYSIIPLSISILFIVLQCIEIPKIVERGFLPFISLIAVVLNFINGLTKFFYLRKAQAQKLIWKVQITEQAIMNGDDDEAKRIFTKYAILNNKLNTLYIVLIFMCDSVFVFAPCVLEVHLYKVGLDYSDVVVDGYKERPFPSDFYVPYNKFKYYKSTFVWNAVGGIANTLFIIAANNLYIGMIIFSVGQLILLRRDTVLLINTCKQKDMRLRLRNIILYHKNIIRFTEELNEVMSTFLLFAVLVYVLQIALICFQMVTQPVLYDISKSIALLGTVLVDLLLFYWYGNEVQLESVNLVESIMSSNWYVCDHQTKKTLLFIMMRAKKPLKFSVGPFYFMSNETMLLILKTCVSYTAAVRTIYDRKHSPIAN